MTDFTTYEYSQRESHAIYLYKFSDGTTSWYYLSGSETAMTFETNNYVPAVIKHSLINQSQNPYDDVLMITAKTSLGIVADNIGKFQQSKIYLSLYKIQNNTAALYKRLFYGYISDFVYNDDTTEIKINSIIAAFNKRVVKNIFGYQCRHILYGSACGLVAADHKHAGTILGITDGRTITATVFIGAANLYLSSLIITADGEKRVIISHSGSNTVTILRPFNQAAIGTTFYVYDKCDRSFDSCLAFANQDNFGGHRHMKNNPYEKIIEKSGAVLT